MAVFLALVQALPAFFQSLPYLCQIALKMITVMEKLVEYSKKRDLLKMFDDIEGGIDKLDGAKTPDEKKAAARDMVNIIGKLG